MKETMLHLIMAILVYCAGDHLVDKILDSNLWIVHRSVAVIAFIILTASVVYSC